MLLRLLCVLLVAAAPLCAQSSVWKVTRGGKSFFLGGTIHLLRPSDFPLPPEFDAAFRQSARLVFETDIGQLNAPNVQAVLAGRGFFTDGATLQSVLSPTAWQRVAAHSRTSPVPLAQLQRMKPWLFAITVTLLELQKAGVASEGVDRHFHDQAVAAGKPTGQLESLEEQIEFITTLGAGHENELVLKSLDDLATLPATIDRAIAAWRRGDLEEIDALMLREWTTKYPAILKGLLTDRNTAWMPKLEALLATPETEFVLVGAGHLPGSQGLLALLRARGCQIEQLRAAPAAKPAPRR